MPETAVSVPVAKERPTVMLRNLVQQSWNPLVSCDHKRTSQEHQTEASSRAYVGLVVTKSPAKEIVVAGNKMIHKIIVDEVVITEMVSVVADAGTSNEPIVRKVAAKG
jgi:hypothetical protein